MSIIYRAVLIALLCFFAGANVIAQLASQQIDSMMEKAMKEFNVVGAAVAVVKDGKVIHEKGYGVRSILTKQPVNEHTNFQIASNSKAFTAAALSILIDERKLSWDDKVKKYLPEFTMYDPYVADNFTVADLLCHRSGLGLGAGDLMFFPDGTDFTIKDVLANFKHLKQVSQFRTKWDYDNLLYLVAGELVHRVSGITWEKFVESRILAPLEMENTFTTNADVKDKANFATPHSDESGPLKAIPHFVEAVNGAAGSLVSNVNDMSQWILTQLNKGKYGSPEKQLFSQARQREMWSIHTVMAGGNPRYNTHFRGYGLGWFLSDTKGNLNVSHTGGLPGMLSYVCMIPDQKLGVVILTNTANGGGALFTAVGTTITDAYQGVELRDLIKLNKANMNAANSADDSLVKKVWQTVEAAKTVKINVQDYAGVYEDPWFGKVEVSMKGDQLWFHCVRSPKLTGPMFYYKANTFAIKWEYQDMPCDAFAMFSLDENGKATGLKMKGISQNIDFSFDFQDLDFVRVKK